MRFDTRTPSIQRRLLGLGTLVLLAIGCGGGSSPTSPGSTESTQGSQQGGSEPGSLPDGSDDGSTPGGGEKVIRIHKTTNGVDADNAQDAPHLALGSAVTWRYEIVNAGSGILSEIKVSDDQIGSVPCPFKQLNPGKSGICFVEGTASTVGLYRNVGKVVANYRISPTGFSKAVEASDPSHYFGFEEDDEGEGGIGGGGGGGGGGGSGSGSGRCGIGFWKNHLEDWPPTGYSPSQSVHSVYSASGAYPPVATASLLQALGFGGGPGAEGGAKILVRHAVGALLNAAHPQLGYPLSPTAVINKVNAALGSGDRDQMLKLKGELESAGSGPCSLSGS